MSLNIDDNRIALAILPLFRLAFRPLFLGGTLFSIIVIAWWSYFWLNPSNWHPYGGPIWWHGHEMLFGFGVAIVVGFLLTAVQTWTGVIGIRGKPLIGLAASWLLGRLLLAFGADLPYWLVMVGDLLFLILSTIAMAYPVLRARQWRNLMFVPILALLALLNGVSHWGVVTEQPLVAQTSLHGAIMMFVLIISILGGRVIPFFTANGAGVERKAPVQWLEITSLTSIILLVSIAFIGFNRVPNTLLVLLSAIATVTNGWRFSRWGGQHCAKIPLLWSLHLAYAFIPLGFIALTLYGAGYMKNLSAALHCFTAGAMGGMILAMISRVTLGHTGRPLKPPALISLAYVFVLSGALVRVIFPGWFPETSGWAIGTAGVLWILGYGIYCYYYAPMLVTTRADGRPG
ncbi:MAG: NnrS family protein [Pseudomonadales bacterium]|nr:NnrS family protein [Pseudomonadales bacterium]